MGLDDAFLCTRLDALRVGSLTQQQSDGTQYDALACARLTGDDREARIQLNVQMVYECVILDKWSMSA